MPKANRSSNAARPALQGVPPLSPRDAAGLIIDLINSRPVSPWPHEIEAIVARAAVASAPGTYVQPSGLVVLGTLTETDWKPERIVSPALEAWNRIVVTHLDALDACKDDADYEALDDSVSEASKVLWGQPVRTWADLVLRAAIAIHWNASDYPDEVLESQTDGHFDERALAHVVRSILDLAGLSFDADGRMLGSDGAGCISVAQTQTNSGGRHHG